MGTHGFGFMHGFFYKQGVMVFLHGLSCPYEGKVSYTGFIGLRVYGFRRRLRV